jgi:hypothetical protein
MKLNLHPEFFERDRNRGKQIFHWVSERAGNFMSSFVMFVQEKGDWNPLESGAASAHDYSSEITLS